MPEHVLVCGFHRSGTSMSMQALVRAGVYPGNALIGADPSNPDGHFEDIETVRLHDRWLAVAGSDWCRDGEAPVVPAAEADRAIEAIADRLDRDATREGRPWGVKDPRATLFLPHWLRALPELRVVIVYRHFASCLDSLQRRQALELLRDPSIADERLRFWTRPGSALGSWLLHNRCALAARDAAPDRCLLVSQEALLAGEPLIERVTARWPFPLDATADTGVDVAKTRRARAIDVPDGPLRGELETVWQRLQHIATAPADPAPTVRWRASTDAECGTREALTTLWDSLDIAA